VLALHPGYRLVEHWRQRKPAPWQTGSNDLKQVISYLGWHGSLAVCTIIEASSPPK